MATTLTRILPSRQLSSQCALAPGVFGFLTSPQPPNADMPSAFAVAAPDNDKPTWTSTDDEVKTDPDLRDDPDEQNGPDSVLPGSGDTPIGQTNIVLATSNSLIESDPELVQSVVDTHAAAVEHMAEDTAAWADGLVEEFALDPAIVESLDDFVARKKAAVPDAFL